ncbi:hypothetical protein J3Q64DRAFT_1859456 [Phycomyces blakesleeanus]|uniref:EF-hand domain-containing protein n=1 Tax=Phycomyces blakesleeanus TaxID=4837 RepID=A0ABR3BGU0_PHYBL
MPQKVESDQRLPQNKHNEGRPQIERQISLGTDDEQAYSGEETERQNEFDVRTITEDFDWGGRDDEDEEDRREDKRIKDKKSLVSTHLLFCISRNASNIQWICLILVAAIFLAICVAVWEVYGHRGQVTTTSYGLQLWFTWMAFMWSIGIFTQIMTEAVPWFIRKIGTSLRPQSTEALRTRLSYYMALRLFTRFVINAAFAWGSWALISECAPLPEGTEKPGYVHIFYSIWECLFFAAILLFVEKLILQMIVSNQHTYLSRQLLKYTVSSFSRKAYGDRIAKNSRELKILDNLRKPKRKPHQEFLLKRIRRKKPENETNSNGVTSNGKSLAENYRSEQMKKSKKSIMTSKPTGSSPEGHGPKQNVRFPSQNMDTLVAIPCVDQLQEDEQDADRSRSSPENSPKIQQRPVDGDDNEIPLSRSSSWSGGRSSYEKSMTSGRDFNISSTLPGKLFRGGYKKLVGQSVGVNQNTSQQAKSTAKRIFYNVAGHSPTRDHIVESDLLPLFETRQQATEAFQMFDKDGNGDISKRELRSGCIRIYRERKNLARSVRDLSQATGKLNIILLVIFIAIWVVIVLASFGVNVGTELMPLWSAFIAGSFIFGNSAKDIFESIIFVFVTHPFDAGDRVMVGEENWVVDNVGLLSSTFLKWDGSVVYVKNSVLVPLYIINCRRTGCTGETADIHVGFETPSWKIHKLRDHMVEWSDTLPHLFTPGTTSANVLSFENQNKITISFYYQHTQNWQDPGGRWLRHNTFMMELKEASERLGVNYIMPLQPVDTKPKINPLDDSTQTDKESLADSIKARNIQIENERQAEKEIREEEILSQRKPYNYNEDGSFSPHNNQNNDNDNSNGAAATILFSSMM